MSTVTTPAPAATTTWNLDPVHTHVQFKVRHLMISNVKGEFTGVKGNLELNSADVTKSRVETTIDASTINTREPQRDAHLKSADFLDVEKFPAITFVSTDVSKRGEGELLVKGDLTIHGVTRNIALEVEDFTSPMKDPWGGTRFGLSAKTRINRKDFGLTWNAALETGGLMVGDEVTINLEAEFVKT